jgi:hypothetical protein
MPSPTIVLPAVGALLMVGAGVAVLGTPFFWLWLAEAAGAGLACVIAFRLEA